MTNTQIKAYLNRIGISDIPGSPTAAALSDLQYAHLTHVPYENLDILRGVRISLDGGDLFEKIVTRRRGGYCFELNKLFGSLLRALGYTVTDYVARYLRDTPGIPHRRHQVLRVASIDGAEFLVDVGVGAVIPLRPVPYIIGTESRQENGVYSLRKDGLFGTVLTEVHNGEIRDVYSFTEDVQLAPDYDYASFWCEFAPDSPFNKQNMLSIRKDGNVRCTLDGDLFREFSPAVVTERRLAPGETDGILADVFGIRL